MVIHFPINFQYVRKWHYAVASTGVHLGCIKSRVSPKAPTSRSSSNSTVKASSTTSTTMKRWNQVLCSHICIRPRHLHTCTNKKDCVYVRSYSQWTIYSYYKLNYDIIGRNSETKSTLGHNNMGLIPKTKVFATAKITFLLLVV